ncbi:hypothetical protein [Lutibacter citreus]|uniref:hypothetical protein n=1 Tax=Lutibacter citreus TaxID=2138210 RepID=UPI000DBE60C7|nr:hypothetical protein [Lutibacter citreus]
MRTRKIVLSMFIIVGLLFNLNTIAQEKEKKTYKMAEITYMLPKIGMEKAFEDAVKGHNEKYHKTGPYKAGLDQILTGEETGWYVWAMGPCMFSDLDNRPKDDAHSSHWDKNVSPTIEKYGRSEYWKFLPEVSVYSGESKPKLIEIWIMEIEKENEHFFSRLLDMVKKVHIKNGNEYRVYNNLLKENNGRDKAIIFEQNNWAELDEDSEFMKTFKEMYKEPNSWEDFLKDWREMVKSNKSQIWRVGI